MADESQKANWPDITVVLTTLTAVIFLASLFFVLGLSQELHHNLLGLCDISDYLRVAPSWAFAALGQIFYQALLHWGGIGSKRSPENIETASKFRRMFLRWRDSNTAQLWTIGFLGVASEILYGIYKQVWMAWAVFLSMPLFYNLFSINLMPGWSRIFQWPAQFAFFVPRTVLILAASYYAGNFWMPIWGEGLSTRTAIMKDHSQYDGKVVLELSRYLVIQNLEGKLIAFSRRKFSRWIYSIAPRQSQRLSLRFRLMLPFHPVLLHHPP